MLVFINIVALLFYLLMYFTFRAVVIAFNMLIGGALIPMTFFGVIKSNKKEFGKSFVWLKIRTD